MTFAIYFLLSFLIPGLLFAFPDQEKIGVSGASPPFDFGFSDTVTGVLLTDDETMYASYGETLEIVDMASFAEAALQPPPLDIDAETDGRLASIAYSSQQNRIFAPQEDGDCLIYDISSITEDPTSVIIAEGAVLGPIAIDNNSQRAYIVNTADNFVNVLNLSSLLVEGTVQLTIPSITGFTVNAAAHNSLTNEIFFTTNKGVVFYMEAGSGAATMITVDPTNTKDLSAVAVTPNGAYVYATNKTDSLLIKIDSNSHAVLRDDIDLTANAGLTGIVITEVTNPQGGGGNAVYAYIAGSKGLSIMNVAGDLVLDMGTDPGVDGEPLPMSKTPTIPVASSVADGYIYTINAAQTVGIITANPWVTISGLTYSGGGSSMGLGESFTITFQADETGTATLMAGGGVSANGTTLTDSTGATSWDVATPDTDVIVTINYDDNTTAFIEGANDIFVFVTDAEGNRGRIATTVNVDTPPPAPTIESIGFGNQKIYVTFDRLDVADMKEYRIYTDTNPADVLTKTEVSATIAQASSGSTQEGQVTGLVNGIAYYVAMDAVDAAGNVSLTRSNTFPDGTAAYGVPQETVGPAELSGEKGCSLVNGTLCGSESYSGYLLIAFSLALLTSLRALRLRSGQAPRSGTVGVILNEVKDPMVSMRLLRPPRRARGPRNGLLSIIVLIAIFFHQSPLFAKDPSPQWWSAEVKTGFWIPKSNNIKRFFGECCNLITRVEGGLLYKGRYGAELGVGIFFKDGTAIGTISGEDSQDSFSFMLIPMETNFVWRVDYWAWDYVLPYLKAGVDYVFFRENLEGSVTKGLKFGFHGTLGTQINLKFIDPDGIKSMDDDFGINDIFLTLEAQYQFINNFGGTGLDLSGPVFSIGLLFEF